MVIFYFICHGTVAQPPIDIVKIETGRIKNNNNNCLVIWLRV